MTASSKTFHFVMIKPSHYDDDGYVIQWAKAYIPSNTLAAIYGIVIVTTHLTMRRARRDPANDYFFSQSEPASWRDYSASAVAVVALVTTGLVLWYIDYNPFLSVAALLLALLTLLYQFVQARRYWMHSLMP